MSADAIRAEAARLKASHGALLGGEPSFYRPDIDRREDAIDAARARLQGGERPAPDQLALDMRPR